MMRKFLAGLLVGLLLAVPFAIWSAPAQADPSESYAELKTAPVQFAHSLSATVSLASTAAVNTLVSCNSNTTLAVVVSFSGSAGDTCLMYVIGWERTGDTYTRCQVESDTAVAIAITGTGGDNVAATLYFELAGAELYEIRNGTPSAGLIRYSAWAFGAHSK